MKKNTNRREEKATEKETLPGYPVYSTNEDIYTNEKKESFGEDSSPDKVAEKEIPNIDEGLDVPGSELDNAAEMNGEEDEENNYYSLGGDGHNDLDEDKDELWQSKE